MNKACKSFLPTTNILKISVNVFLGSEYKSLIEKYQKVKEDYEKKFRLSCQVSFGPSCSDCWDCWSFFPQNFQKLEEEHLSQMKEYLANYSQILQSGHALVGQVYKEFSNNCNEESVEKLLEKFTTSKRTTNKRPGKRVHGKRRFTNYTGVFTADIQFEEANANFVQLNVPSVAVPSASTFATQSSTSSKSSGGSGNYTSSLDLINLEMMPQNISTANEFGSNFDSTFFPKSEGKGRKYLANYSNSGVNASQIDVLKQKRSAYSSRYAFSLVELNTTTNSTNTSSSFSRAFLSSQTTTTATTCYSSLISSITAISTTASSKCVTINPLVFGMVSIFPPTAFQFYCGSGIRFSFSVLFLSASGGSERTKLELTKSDSNSAVVVSDTISNKSADRFDDGDRGSRKDSLSQCDSPPITNHHHKSFPDIRIISNFRTSKCKSTFLILVLVVCTNPLSNSFFILLF